MPPAISWTSTHSFNLGTSKANLGAHWTSYYNPMLLYSRLLCLDHQTKLIERFDAILQPNFNSFANSP